MIIKYINKEELFPKFGLADIENKTIYIRNDLPTSVTVFVSLHEQYHLKDTSTNWIWREIKANLSGAYKCPHGFIYCCILSLSPSRIKFYLKRLKEGN